MGLFDLFSNDSAEKARDMANAGARAGYDQLQGLYGQGRDALTTGFNNASGAYTNLLNGANAGAGAYGDASGANGAQGFQRAQQNFRTDPGYQFQMDQGLQGLTRAHAAGGNLVSGNTDTDALTFSQGLADQSWGNYVNRLAPYLGQQNIATAGYGNAQAGLGTGLNQSFDNQGGAANTTQTKIGENNAGAEMNNYKVGANQLNALLGVGSLAFGGAGGAGGFGGLLNNGYGGTGFSLGPTSVGGAPVKGGLFSSFGNIG